MAWRPVMPVAAVLHGGAVRVRRVLRRTPTPSLPVYGEGARSRASVGYTWSSPPRSREVRVQTSPRSRGDKRGGLVRTLRPAGRGASLVLGVVVLVFALLPSGVQAQRGTTERVSVSSTGEQGNDGSYFPSLSADGRFVAFSSGASNLVAGDTDWHSDVFVRDRHLGATERVSVSSSGAQGNSGSGAPSISANGRFVAFVSWASNLDPGDTNGTWDVFVRDRLLGTTERVSVSSSGAQGNSASYNPSITGDGRFVAFYSYASNFVPGDTNERSDVFVRDRQLGTTERVSISSTGAQGNNWSAGSSISADGRFVAFHSDASNLVAGDTNGYRDVFVRDRHLGITERVSVSSSGAQGNAGSGYDYDNPSISADGRFVAFESWASNLVAGDTNGYEDVFVRDRLLGATERVSVSSSGAQGNSGSGAPSISADGRFVVFHSGTWNLVAGDTNGHTDVFVRDKLLGTTVRLSVSSSGAQGNGATYRPSISADGRFVAFESYASNLVAGDTNERSDVFVHQYGYDEPWPTVAGKLSFEGWSASPPSFAPFQLRNPGQGENIGVWQAALGPDGSFSVPAPFGVSDLSVKHTHWLRKTVAFDTSAGPANVGVLTLVNGDADGDNTVGLWDLNRVLILLAKSDPMADLDGSGVVDAPDLTIVLLNFTKAGDP